MTAGLLRRAGPDGDRWTVGLDTTSAPYLADHVVQGVPVLPGSVYLDLFRGAVRAAGLGSPPVLRDVCFTRAFVVPGAGGGGLAITVSPAGSGGWDLVATGADTGVRHATAHVPAAGAASAASVPVDPSDARWQRGRTLSGDQLYDAMRAAGNEFGPAFRGVAECRVDAGAATARLTGGVARHPVEAATLDAAMQALAAAGGAARRDALVLTGVDEVRWHDRTADRVFALLRPGWPETDHPVGDALLVDAAGRPAVELIGVRLRRLPPARTPAAPRPRVAVAATFTAEPLADALTFWLGTLGLDATVEFAPYRQVYQQLLDPGSLLSANADGANVLLVRLPDLAARPAVAPPARVTGDGPKYHLPGVGEVAHLLEYETAFLYDEIFVRRAYLSHGFELPDDAVVVDVGANIGLFTLFVHGRCPGARVYAFEPAPAAAEALRRNVAAHCPDTRVYDVGLAETETERPFTYYRNSSAFSGFAADRARDRANVEAVARNVLRSLPGPPPPDAEALLDRLLDDRLDARVERRRTTTLSRVISDEGLSRIDLLKIDAEGYEDRVLEGIADEDWPAIRQVVVEAHDADRARRVRDVLAGRGFTVAVDEGDDFLRGTGFAYVYARRPGAGASPPDWRRASDELLRAVRRAAEAAVVPFVVVLCPPAGGSPDRAERRLADGLSAIPGVQVITSRDVQAVYPVAQLADPRAEELGDVPYTGRYFAALGTLVARRILATRRPPAKVLALDCDETLWAGRCGEDGPAGVRIEASHRALQEYAVRRHAEGTLLCLCSRNNAADVLAVFDGRDDMPLRREHLSAWRLNWAAKSDNVAALAAELGVGIDSVVLLDDDPVECAQVRAHRPEALTVCLPADRTRVPAVLDHLWAFDRTEATEEDRIRARWYRTERDRDAARAATEDFASFLAGLDLRVTIEPWTPADLPRISQLSERVNQFTTASARLTPARLRAGLAAGLDCRTVRVTDRFGDYGLVGALLFTGRPDRLVVEGFLLSCRALGRGVEHRMLAALGEIALGRGLDRIDVPVVDTGRNSPALAFFAEAAEAVQPEAVQPEAVQPEAVRPEAVRLEAVRPEAVQPEAVQPEGDGTRFTMSAHAAARTVHQPDRTRPPAPAPVPPGPRRAPPVPYRRIAEELNDLDAIIAAIEGSRTRRRPPLGAPAGAPDDDLEREIVAVWRSVLAVDEVGMDDNFFELGGTSLRAVQLTGELSSRFGQPLPAIGVFEHPTVRAMAELVRGGAGRDDEGRRRGLRRRATRRRAAGQQTEGGRQ